MEEHGVAPLRAPPEALHCLFTLPRGVATPNCAAGIATALCLLPLPHHGSFFCRFLFHRHLVPSTVPHAHACLYELTLPGA